MGNTLPTPWRDWSAASSCGNKTSDISSRVANGCCQVGSDDDGYSVRMKLKHFLRYLADPAHAPADDSPLYIFDGEMH